MSATAARAAQATGAAPLRSVVLVVDDEPIVASELAAGLSDMGHEVSFALSAAAALGILATRPEVTVLVTDIRMPGTDGLDLARAATAARGEEAALSIVLITGHATPEDLARAMPDGAPELIRKPFRLKEIGAAVARAHQRAAHRRALAPPARD